MMTVLKKLARFTIEMKFLIFVKLSSFCYSHNKKLLVKLQELVRREKLLCDAVGSNGHQKVVEFVHPKELETCLGGLEIGTEPTSPEDVKTFMEAVVRYSVKTCHHRFYNQVTHSDKLTH